MFLKKFFINTSLYLTFRAVRGSFLGILSGLGLGLIIWGLLVLLDMVFPSESAFKAMPPSSIAFVTMILGCLVGSVFGFCAGMKDMDYTHNHHK